MSLLLRSSFPFESLLTHSFPELFSGFASGLGSHLVEAHDDMFVYEFPTPGMGKKDVSITLSGHVLYVNGRKENKKSQGKSSSSYDYVEQLPHDCDVEDVKATIEDGMVIISVKRLQNSQKNRQIKID